LEKYLLKIEHEIGELKDLHKLDLINCGIVLFSSHESAMAFNF